MELPKTTQGAPLHDQTGGSARVQALIVAQSLVLHINPQGRQRRRKNTTGLVISQQLWLAACLPTGQASLPADDTAEP